MNRAGYLWPWLLAASLLAGNAGAADPGNDYVDLVGGGFIRGTVVVFENGKRVVIQLADGRTETLTWDKVKKVRLGGGGSADEKPGKPKEPPKEPPKDPPKDPEPAPAAETPSVPPEQIPEHVRPAEMPGYEPAINVIDRDAAPEVQLVLEAGEGAKNVKVVREREGGSTEVVCSAPCGAYYPVTVKDRFYVDGDGMPRSPEIDLYDTEGDVKAVVKPGTTLFYVGGISLAAVGFAGALGAGIYTAVEADGLSYWPPEPEPFATVLIAGGGLLLGVAGTIAAVMGRTDVKVLQGDDVGLGKGGLTWRF